jgi:hypothetical protein
MGMLNSVLVKHAKKRNKRYNFQEKISIIICLTSASSALFNIFHKIFLDIKLWAPNNDT